MFSKNRKRTLSFIVVLMTFALSSLGTTIVFPILAPLFLSKSEAIIRAEIPENIKSILFGFFLAAYPLAQLLFSPFIGNYSDRVGRKKVFLITLFLEIVGYVLSGIGIKYHHLSILFLGRFITGLGAGNFTVCLASIADLSADEKSKTLYFSYGSAVAGGMFIFGPILGGRFSDSSISPLYNFAFPLWIGAFLALINLVLVYFFFYDPLNKIEKASKNSIKAMYSEDVGVARSLYVIFFFFLFAWNMLYQFLPALLVEKFAGTSLMIGNLSALMGIVWFVGTVIISYSMRFTEHQKIILTIAFAFFGITALFISFPNQLLSFGIISAVAVFIAGGIWPILVGAISRTSKFGAQGKTLGISQSVQSLSMLLASLFGGFFLQVHNKIPFVFSSLTVVVAMVLLIKIKPSIFKM